MFIGHFGLGFGAKKAASSVSLGTFFIAAQFLDLLWPVLLLLDVEHAVIKPGTGHAQPIDFTDYPISHSLVMVIGWALLYAFIYWLFKKNIKAALVLGLCVISHWVLDLIVHLPDLPLYPGNNSAKYGFELWNSFWGTLLVEGGIFITGLVLYIRSTTAKNKQGSIGLWILVALLLVSHAANLFGPPPPAMNAVAWAGNLQWLFVILAYWVDHNRSAI
ncbi:MAG TPA: hypothetical protein PKC54_15310 [Ferruginibacter sp.]|nr:hypothetical protein [Ferruginibacter sp.]